MNNKKNTIYYLKYFSFFVVCGLLIVAYGLFRCYKPGFIDPFAKSFVNNNILKEYLDGWALLHLFFYMLMTYLYTDEWWLTAIIGVIWELIELSSKDKPFYMPSCFYMSKTNENNKSPWWYGRYQDIIMNSIGGAIGYLLAKYTK